MKNIWTWVLRTLIYERCEGCGESYDPYNDECKNCVV
jgi:uncharacterized OB-fold protein